MKPLVPVRRWAIALLALLAALPATTVRPQAGPRAGRIAGLVFDSLLSNAPLAGAEVSVVGTSLVAFSDTEGRFRIDSIPSGRYALTFFHPLLDSLGFGARPAAFEIANGDELSVRLVTPSPLALHESLCHMAPARATGVLIGRVKDVDSSRPAGGAEISAEWSEWTLGAGRFGRTEQRVVARADTTGSFALCGVANDVPVVVRAWWREQASGYVALSFEGRAFAVRHFVISLADTASRLTRFARRDTAATPAASVPTAGSAWVTGRVRTREGRAVHGAQAALLGAPLSTRTDTSGAFRLVGVPAGTQTIEVRAIGYAPVRTAIELGTGERDTMTVVLDERIQELATVQIVGFGTTLDRSGFIERKLRGHGHFIGPEEIARARAFEIVQLLHAVPGGRIRWNGFENVFVVTRGLAGGMADPASEGCVPVYFLDGHPIFGPTGIRPADVRAVEVYTRLMDIPVQFRRQDNRCGAVLIWTRAHVAGQ